MEVTEVNRGYEEKDILLFVYILKGAAPFPKFSRGGTPTPSVFGAYDFKENQVNIFNFLATKSNFFYY